MDEKRLRVALKLLDKVKVQEQEQECLKENISAEEVIFFTILEAKS